MQKCLHSSHKTGRKRIFAILTIFVIFAVALRWSGNGFSHKNDENYMYLRMYGEEKAKKTATAELQEVAEKIKMNNFDDENSKSECSNEPAVSPVLEESIVEVVDNSGKTFKIELEEYVLGCLIGEMPIVFNSQALMAQSVAVRSFTVNKILYGSKHANGAVCTNPSCCQNYISPEKSGISDELLEKAREAVGATRGVVAVYEGKVINAVYHAGSAEQTKDSLQVWGSGVAYLKSVKSPPEEAEICAEKYSGSSGHGVGMSQQGANILADKGYGYAEILKYYYSSVKLEILKINE